MLAGILMTACGGREAGQHEALPDPADADVALDAWREILDAGKDVRSDAADGPVFDPDRQCAGHSDPSDLVGSIEGRSVRIRSSSASMGGFPKVQPSWSLLRTASVDEAVLAWGVEIDGAPPEGSGQLVVPDDPPPGSVHYCASSVEAKLQASDADAGHVVSIVLDGLSELGRCPGVPVSGELTLCQGDGSDLDGGPAGCAFQRELKVVGSVDGMPLTLGYLGGIAGTNIDQGIVHLVLGGANAPAIVITNRADGSIAGWLKVPNDNSPMAGLTYCLSSATIRKYSEGAYSINFASIGRLGPCPGRPVQGRVGLCW